MRRAIRAFLITMAIFAAVGSWFAAKPPRKGTICTAQPMPDDDALEARSERGLPAIERTACENRALEQTFCAAVAARPSHDVAGIEPAWDAAVEEATGDGRIRAGFIAQDYFTEMLDGKTRPACGFEIRGLRTASN
ncbi:MAG TPA: hypothetical protein VNF29_10955 [Candidatus Binataceae bacterium]|nr:hypothetical protein [Candidatus Binataceae bacterium]